MKGKGPDLIAAAGLLAAMAACAGVLFTADRKSVV